MRDRISELMDRHDLEERLLAFSGADDRDEEREGSAAAGPPGVQAEPAVQSSSPPSTRPVRRRPARRATAADAT